MSEDTLERMLIEMNVQRYVRGNISRNVRYVLDKIVKKYVRRNVRK